MAIGTKTGLLGNNIAGVSLEPVTSEAWPEIPTSSIRTDVDGSTVGLCGPPLSSSSSSTSPLSNPTAARLGDHSTPDVLLSPKRRKLHQSPSPAVASSLSASFPLVSAQASNSSPPRTPSPQIKIESSFFSPTFFSPSSGSSSPTPHDRLLPSSSPPTSPLPCSSPAWPLLNRNVSPLRLDRPLPRSYRNSPRSIGNGSARITTPPPPHPLMSQSLWETLGPRRPHTRSPFPTLVPSLRRRISRHVRARLPILADQAPAVDRAHQNLTGPGVLVLKGAMKAYRKLRPP